MLPELALTAVPELVNVIDVAVAEPVTAREVTLATLANILFQRLALCPKS